MMQEVVTNGAENHFARYSHVESELLIDGCEPDLLPDLSVMIPTFRRPHLLKEAIVSILNQTAHGLNIEIVIVDNDAESESLELAILVKGFSSSNIRLFRNKENIGMFGNWNRCIELARAPKLTILNDDDILHPDFIKTVLTSESQAALSVAYVQFNEIKNLTWPQIITSNKLKKLTRTDFFQGNPIPGSLGLLMNKNQATQLGGYNPDLWPTADYDFSYRYCKFFGIKQISSKLAAYRWQDNESMKVATLEGFLANDIKFRSEIINDCQVAPFRFLLQVLSGLITTSNAIGYNSVNDDFDVYKNIARNKVLCGRVYIFFLKLKPLNRVFRGMLNRLISCKMLKL
ncbi:glycosyltransferase family 2 protein [Shewanella oncorhynchi]|uniref:glycosyltransferase family 2 protein n=1 Tax=Shewanella oncorhynchi TaxID=2726434 RepID=UPI003D798BEC